MPPRDPSAVQLDFPLLVAELIDELRLTGQLGLLNFLPEVRPTFIIGSRAGAIQVTASPVIYAVAEIFDATANNAPANTVVLDTGALPAGDYDVKAFITYALTAVVAVEFLELEHRDAADAVTLNTWRLGLAVGHDIGTFEFSTEVALNERFRVKVGQGSTGKLSGTIMVKIRPAP